MKSVLLIGLSDDAHVHAVSAFLKTNSIHHIIYDPTCDEQIPNVAQSGLESGKLSWKDGQSIDIDDNVSVYCRFALDSLRPSEDLDDLNKYAAYERLQAVLACLRNIPVHNWINDPWFESRADCKIYQRNVAAKLGLDVPDQYIGNDPLFAEAYFAEAKMVIKPISDTTVFRRNGSYICDRPIFSDDFEAPYTSEYSHELGLAPGYDETPFLLQQKISAVADLRVITIDQSVTAFRFDRTTGGHVDFRKNILKRPQIVDLPAHTHNALVDLNQKLRVRFSASDFILDQDGKLVYLESNVSGNFLYCDVGNGMRVTQLIGEALTA